MIQISTRKYYRNFLFAVMVIGALILIGALVTNHLYFHFETVNKICKYVLISESLIVITVWLIIILKNKGLKQYISKMLLLRSIENNLISIGAFIQCEDKEYVELPKIKIDKGKVTISLTSAPTDMIANSARMSCTLKDTAGSLLTSTQMRGRAFRRTKAVQMP